MGAQRKHVIAIERFFARQKARVLADGPPLRRGQQNGWDRAHMLNQM